MDVKERRKAVEFLSDVSDRYKAFEHLKKSICDNMYQDIFNFITLNGITEISMWASKRIQIISLFIERNTVYCECLELPLFGFAKAYTHNVRRLDRIFGNESEKKYLELSQLLLQHL